MAERRYSEEEVALILRNATESHPGASAADGLTLAELKQIATDVGIDAEAVEAAAGSLDRRIATTPSPLVGTPVAPQYEQVIDVPFDRVDQSELVLAIRRAMERHGVVDAGPDGLEWRARDATGGRYVSVLARGSRTLVRALGNFREGAMAWVLGGGVMTWAGSLILLKSLGLLTPGIGKGISVLAAAAIGYLGGRLLWGWQYRREQRRLQATLEAAVATIRSAQATPRLEKSSGGDS